MGTNEPELVSPAVSCGVGRRRTSNPVLLWLWRRLARVALIGPLAWEPPHATGAALKSKKKKSFPSLHLLCACRGKYSMGGQIASRKLWNRKGWPDQTVAPLLLFSSRKPLLCRNACPVLLDFSNGGWHSGFLWKISFSLVLAINSKKFLKLIDKTILFCVGTHSGLQTTSLLPFL